MSGRRQNAVTSPNQRSWTWTYWYSYPSPGLRSVTIEHLLANSDV
jgi:hypothetical protein